MKKYIAFSLFVSILLLSIHPTLAAMEDPLEADPPDQ